MPGNKSLRGWLVKGRERASHDTADTHFGATCIVGIHGKNTYYTDDSTT
jgi:hypothetical protein